MIFRYLVIQQKDWLKGWAEGLAALQTEVQSAFLLND